MSTDDTPPRIWWSPTVRGLIGEYVSESGSYEVIARDSEGWYVGSEQEIDLPADAIELRPVAAPNPLDGADDLPAAVRIQLRDRRDVVEVLREYGHTADEQHVAASVRAALRGQAVPALPPAASHIEYTVELLAEQLRQDPDDAAALTVADDPELLRILARIARESVGVCPACDGSGARELQWGETDVGPEDCPHCEGDGWLPCACGNHDEETS